MDTVRRTCMTTMELVEICKTGRVIALASRDDEENTRYAVELCECMSRDNIEDSVYFSLKRSLEEFERAYPGAFARAFYRAPSIVGALIPQGEPIANLGKSRLQQIEEEIERENATKTEYKKKFNNNSKAD